MTSTGAENQPAVTRCRDRSRRQHDKAAGAPLHAVRSGKVSGRLQKGFRAQHVTCSQLAHSFRIVLPSFALNTVSYTAGPMSCLSPAWMRRLIVSSARGGRMTGDFRRIGGGVERQDDTPRRAVVAQSAVVAQLVRHRLVRPDCLCLLQRHFFALERIATPMRPNSGRW